jgi:hypothetical protein
MVRGLRTSANSSTLDDRRPARRSTSYHATAETAIIFRGPYRKPQAAEIQASHCRDHSLLMRGDAQVFLRFLALRSRDDLVEADDDDNRTILATGFVFFEARIAVQKANGLHMGKAQRRMFATADRFQQSPRSQEQDRSPNEPFSGTRVVSTNDGGNRAAEGKR